MKRATLILALVAVALFVVGGFLYSSENVKPVETDLAKYSEMSPFLAGRTGFRGIRFNLDTNYYSFAFPTELGTADVYFGAVDSAATKAGWSLVGSAPSSRVYTRKKPVAVGPVQSDKVTLSYDAEKKEVTVVREDVSKSKE